MATEVWACIGNAEEGMGGNVCQCDTGGKRIMGWPAEAWSGEIESVLCMSQWELYNTLHMQRPIYIALEGRECGCGVCVCGGVRLLFMRTMF